MGTAVDDAAHALGSGLNAVGLHDAANAVGNFGDHVADHLGDEVAEKQLGQTTDPTQLVHADVDAINRTVSDLNNFAVAFGDTAHGLARIDTAHWRGGAADAFRAAYRPHPKAWSNAQDACTTAIAAWESYGRAVASAQHQAQQAINLYQQGTQATAHAQARYNQAAASYQQQASAYTRASASGQDPGPMPQPPGVFVDPGAADRDRAQQILTAARQHRDEAGGQARRAIAAAIEYAPTTPDFTQRMVDDVSDTIMTVGVEGEHLVGGIAKGAGDMVKFVRGLDPIDPYNVTHPADYVDHLSRTAAGLVHVALHPQELATGLVGSGWSSDPAEALGRLIPNTLAVIGTGAVGEAAEGAEATSVTEGALAGDGVVDAATAARTTEAAGRLEQVEHDLTEIHVNDNTALSSTTGAGHPSVGTVAPPPTTSETLANAGRDGRSVIQRRLDGLTDLDAGPTGTRGRQPIDDATAALSKLERDLADIHVHPVRPDYADPCYGASEAEHQAYLDDHPVTPEADQWLDAVRTRNAVARDIPDAELLSLDTYKTAGWQINKALRSGNQALLSELDPEIRNLASALNKLPDFTGPVVRGIEVDPADLRAVLTQCHLAYFDHAAAVARRGWRAGSWVDRRGGRRCRWIV